MSVLVESAACLHCTAAVEGEPLYVLVVENGEPWLEDVPLCVSCQREALQQALDVMPGERRAAWLRWVKGG